MTKQEAEEKFMKMVKEAGSPTSVMATAEAPRPGIWFNGHTWLVKNLDGNFISRNGKVKVENFLDAHWVASLALEVDGSNIFNLDARGPTPQKAADALALMLADVKSAVEEF